MMIPLLPNSIKRSKNKPSYEGFLFFITFLRQIYLLPPIRMLGGHKCNIFPKLQVKAVALPA
jgi:hypothetical protein